MEIWEIFLAAAGIIIILASFMASDKKEPQIGQAINIDRETIDLIVEESRKNFQDKMDQLLTERADEVILKTDDHLSRISNEKIMAVSEYSDQVLEKIEQNHSEVIFLYNTLGEKEKEMKELVRKIDKSKIVLEEAILSGQGQGAAISKKKDEKQEPPKAAGRQADKIKQELKKTAPAKLVETVGQNQNEKILGLYKEGKSIMEISKLIGQGQGEVKLVIDLFLGRS